MNLRLFGILFLISAVGLTGVFVLSNNANDDKELLREEPIEQPIEEPVIETILKEEEFSLEAIKAVYVTSWSASNESYIDYLIRLAKDTEINGAVIDIKDWSGYISYNSKVPEVLEYKAKRIIIKDIESLIERLHKEGLYLIARITVFQDPKLAQARPELAIQSKSAEVSQLWLDKSGVSWIDPSAKESWEYNASIAKEALSLGFDEVNFDYVRFPSDGDLKDAYYPVWDGTVSRHLIIKEFFKYLRKEIPEGKMSVDLFGLSTISFGDLGVGQIIEDSFEYFDYVCPMVYPSHYALGSLGFENPAEHPYEIVEYSIESALKRILKFNPENNVKLRPWLQDFSLGAIYDAGMVKSQIEAVYNATGDHFAGYFLWDSANTYTKEAVLEKTLYFPKLFEVNVKGHYVLRENNKTGQSEVYFKLINAPEYLIERLDFIIKRGNRVNIKEEGEILFNLGCLKDGMIIADGKKNYINQETLDRIFSSLDNNFVDLKISFKPELEKDCFCCSMADSVF